MTLKILVILAVISTSAVGSACRIVSLEKNPMRYIYNMIKTTPDIYYAEATSYSKEDESFSFKVLEILKGQKRKEFSVLGNPVPDGVKENDFGGHRAQGFWEDVTTARTTFGSDCRLNPMFKIGSRYVIFLKEPYQAKSFELVKNRKDKWFEHIYEAIHPVKKKVFTGVNPTGYPPGNLPATDANMSTPAAVSATAAPAGTQN
jgi:hypothetical protein